MFKKYKKFLNKLTTKILTRAYFSNKKTYINLRNILLSDKGYNKKIHAIIGSDIKYHPELSRLLSHAVINNYYKTNKLEEDYDKFLGGKDNYIAKNIKSEKKALNISILGMMGIVFFICLSLIGNGFFSFLFFSLFLSIAILASIGLTAGFLAELHDAMKIWGLYTKNNKASKKLMKDLDITEPDDTYKFLMTLMTINKYDEEMMKEIEEILAQFSGFESKTEFEQKITIKEAKENIDKLKEKILLEAKK